MAKIKCHFMVFGFFFPLLKTITKHQTVKKVRKCAENKAAHLNKTTKTKTTICSQCTSARIRLLKLHARVRLLDHPLAQVH